MHRAFRLKRFALLSVFGILGVLAWADSPIQWRGSKGWEPESAYCRLYDAHHVVTLKGTVERVEKIVPMQGMGYGVYLMLKTATETIPVHLGPTEFVEKQPVQLHAKDVIEVMGSRVSCDGKPALLAASIRRGDESVKFREITGRPAWAASTPKKQD